MPCRVRNLLMLSVLLVFCGTVSSPVTAADTTLTFEAVGGSDADLVQDILFSNLQMKDLVQRDYIRITKDVRIAKADLDDSGEDEVLLLVKHNGDPPCTQEPCQLQVWKHQATMLGAWKRLGTYQMMEEKLTLYDEKYNGFHEIANSHGIIPWDDN